MLTALEYLESFESTDSFQYLTLHKSYIEHVPFGDRSHQSLPKLQWTQPEIMSSTIQLIMLTFDFETEPNLPDLLKDKESLPNLVVLATPCDPRGPFTLSVYQDHQLRGWLVGAGQKELACHLVETFDFAAATVPVTALIEKNGKLQVQIFIQNVSSEPVVKSQLTSQNLVAPSELQWSGGPNILELPENINWDGIAEVSVAVQNPQHRRILDQYDIAVLSSDEIVSFVPDVWVASSRAVFVYLNDSFLGRIIDPEDEAKFHAFLLKGGYHIGTAAGGTMCEDDESDNYKLDVYVEPRSNPIRIEWERVAGEQ